MQENDFLRRTLAVMQVNKEIGGEIIKALTEVKKNTLWIFGMAMWILIVAVAFFVYFLFGALCEFFTFSLSGYFLGSFYLTVTHHLKKFLFPVCK